MVKKLINKIKCLFRLHEWSEPCAILGEWFGVECIHCLKRRNLE